jgi:pectinesterase
MPRTLLALLLLSFCGAFAAPAPSAPAAAPTIYIIGDSTAANKAKLDYPERGWGQLFPELVIAPAKLDNRALNGRSTKSFIAEKHWTDILKTLQPGDWVIMQFGHNDQKVDKPAQSAPADGLYRDNLRRFIRETREHGAFPVVATSVVRRHWDDAGKFLDTLGDYPAAARAVAAEEKVPLLEIHDLTLKMESEAGIEGSKHFHLWPFPGEIDGLKKDFHDDSHFSALGARRVAALVAAEIHRLGLPLATWVRLAPSGHSSAPARPRRRN